MHYTQLTSRIRVTSTTERELTRTTVGASGIAGKSKDFEMFSFVFCLKLVRKVIICLPHRIRFQPVRYLESFLRVCVCVCVCVCVVIENACFLTERLLNTNVMLVSTKPEFS